MGVIQAKKLFSIGIATDYKKMLKPCNLRIEELGINKNDAPLIAEKPSGSSEIN